MRIHLLSDLHNEFETYQPSTVDADIVVLAGDIDVKARGVEWAKRMFKHPVLYVLGNHGKPTVSDANLVGLMCAVELEQRLRAASPS
jgi:predicted phosphodiesterase